MVDLKGKIAFIAGGGSRGDLNNGRAAAQAYARAGAQVAVVDRSGTDAKRTVDVISAEGGSAIAIEADVTDESSVREAVDRTRRELGAPSILHNNVGVALPGSWDTMTLDQWQTAIDINLTGAFLTCKHVLPLMVEAGRGSIINISSLASIRDTGYVYPAYSAAKAGLNQLTVSIALTYARQGVRANAILPGMIATPLVTEQVLSDVDDVEAALAARHAHSPTGAMGSPWDIAHAAVFLASPEAAYINGVCLPVDGGMSARC